MHNGDHQYHFMIACGGTGGHLFPGLRVAEVLRQRNHKITLLVSSKEVDQSARRPAQELGLAIEVLPAVGWERGGLGRFFSGFAKSLQVSHRLFREAPPRAVLAMGGFTSAAPVCVGRKLGVSAYLHEGNSIPGRANRWLAPWVSEAFVYFPSAAPRLRCSVVRWVGMPVRPQIQPLEPSSCRIMLGLEASRPVLTITGGSQGAHGLNELVLRAVPHLQRSHPELQYLHLTGAADAGAVRRFYDEHQLSAVVKPFLTEMELALNAATVVVSRAGASSIAELAALRVPAILVPFPASADQHQQQNARLMAQTGAARSIEQNPGAELQLSNSVDELIENAPTRGQLSHNLAQWHQPLAAELIADRLLQLPHAT